ncbi:MAG: hypothetical protein NXI10_07445 [bacterium]|nr:hypothetical protein [bacterium]
MKQLLILFLLFVGFTLHGQEAFKHDIGFRINSFHQERFQMQYRFHKNERINWTIDAHFNEQAVTNGRGEYDSQNTDQYILTSEEWREQYLGVNVGFQYKFFKMKYNFYYIGMKVGYTHGFFRYIHDQIIYEYHQFESFYPFGKGGGAYPKPKEITAVNYWESKKQNEYMQTCFNAGGSFPIDHRLLLNVEVGWIAGWEREEYSNATSYDGYFPWYASGGLLFQFGK